jgi:hypothetical protein
MEVFFHIGLQKTGTTFLQRELFSKIKDSNFQYVDGHDHPQIFNSFRFQDPIYFDENQVRQEIACLAEGKMKLLISFEDLSGHPYNAAQARSVIADKIKRCFPNAKILFFVRRQDSFAVSSYLQTVNGGNNYSLKEYYRTVFEGNHHDRFICPTLDYFKFSRYVDYLTSQFGKSNCFIAPYEHFMSHNESVISELLLFLGVNFEYSPSSNKQNQQKGLIYTFLLRLENYFLARRISSNPSLFTGIPVYNFRKKKKSYLTLKNILTFLLKKGLFLDTKYKDRTDTSKRILELCKDDNRQLDEIHSLGIASYGYY